MFCILHLALSMFHPASWSLSTLISMLQQGIKLLKILLYLMTDDEGQIFSFYDIILS